MKILKLQIFLEISSYIQALTKKLLNNSLFLSISDLKPNLSKWEVARIELLKEGKSGSPWNQMY